MSTYLLILGGAILPPFLLSFDRKVAFYRRWKFLFPSIFIVAALFIAWDVAFTRTGVWGFSEPHLSGLRLLSLPVEEWLFFIIIPYAAVFTYDVVKAYRIYGKDRPNLISLTNLVLITGSVAAVLLFRGRAYTVTTFSLLAVLLAFHQGILRKAWLQPFYVSYLLVIFPFLIVNGMLTGTAVEGEVVWYNSDEFMGLRILTIPLEDLFYGFSLVLMNVSLYEYFQERSGK